jgi:arginine utilization protein RocB
MPRAPASDPFTPARRDGWLIGRGARDMKGGFAMGLLAVSALRQAMPGAIGGELGFLDEGVELSSIVAGARTVARFIAGFFARGWLR